MIEIKIKSSVKGNLLIFVTALLWSFIGVCTKTISPEINGLIISGVSGIFAVSVIKLANFKHRLVLNKITVASGMSFSLTNTTFFLANQHTTVTNTIVLQYVSLIFVLLFNIFIERYRPKKSEVAAVFLCVIGLIVFFSDQISSGQLFGNIMAIVSGFFFGIYFFLMAKPATDTISATIVAYGMSAILGTISMMIIPTSIPGTSDLPSLVVMGALLSGVAAVLFAKGISKTTALNANMIALSEVFLSSFWAYLLFNETMGKYSAIGLGLMIIAIITETIVNGKADDMAAKC